MQGSSESPGKDVNHAIDIAGSATRSATAAQVTWIYAYSGDDSGAGPGCESCRVHAHQRSDAAAAAVYAARSDCCRGGRGIATVLFDSLCGYVAAARCRWKPCSVCRGVLLRQYGQRGGSRRSHADTAVRSDRELAVDAWRATASRANVS